MMKIRSYLLVSISYIGLSSLAYANIPPTENEFIFTHISNAHLASQSELLSSPLFSQQTQSEQHDSSVPISLAVTEGDKLPQLASVCFITDTGACRGDEFGSNNSPENPGGGAPDDWEIDKNKQCYLEGYTLTSCNSVQIPTNYCPYDATYFEKCVCKPGLVTCTKPYYGVGESCDGKYASCQLDNARACREDGYAQTGNCPSLQVINKKCPYDPSYFDKCVCRSDLISCPSPLQGVGESCGGKYTSCQCPSNYQSCNCGAAAGASSCTWNGVTKYSSCKACCSDTCYSGSKSVSCNSSQNKVQVSTTECGSACYTCQAKHSHSYYCPSGYSTSCSNGYSSTTSKRCSCGATSGTCYKCNASHSHSYYCPSGYSTYCSNGYSSTTSKRCSCGATSGTCYKCNSTSSHTHSYSCPSGYSTSCSNGYSSTTSKRCSCGATSGTCYKCNSTSSHTHSYSCPSGYQASSCGSGYTQTGTTSKKCSCGATSGTCYKCTKQTHTHSYSCPSGYQASSCGSGYTQTGTTSKTCSCGAKSGTCYKCTKKTCSNTCSKGSLSVSCATVRGETKVSVGTTGCGNTCYECRCNATCASKGYSSSKPSGKTCSMTIVCGSTCYYNCKSSSSGGGGINTDEDNYFANSSSGGRR